MELRNFDKVYEYIKTELQVAQEEEISESLWATYYIPNSQFQFEVHQDLTSGTITIYHEKRTGDDLVPYTILDNKGYLKVFRVER